MQCSVVKKANCAKYDFGFLLFSPDFFLQDKLANWDILDKLSSKAVCDYFWHIKDTVKEITQPAICYDLTDALSKFFDGGVELTNIRSTKKIAKAGDFLISRMSSYLEEMGIVEKQNIDQLFSSEFLVFRAKTKQVSTYTLFALCMIQNVQIILKRGQYGVIHPRFYDFLLTGLPFPNRLLYIDKYIKAVIGYAIKIRSQSKSLYQQAQNILLAELDLLKRQPKHKLSFIKNYSDIKEAERIDADYFQPKYDEIINAIKGYSGGWDTLGNLVNIKEDNYRPKEKQEYKYIELANVGNNGEITSYTKEQGLYLPSRAKRMISEGDIIVSSIEGSLSSIALIGKEYNNAICSTGFYVINSQNLNSETLLVFLKSVIGQLQLNRGCSGTILTAINKDEFRRVVLPNIRMFIQTQIRLQVEESFILRNESKHLLECAKRAVEIAIEEDEQTAVNWLDANTDIE